MSKLEKIAFFIEKLALSPEYVLARLETLPTKRINALRIFGGVSPTQENAQKIKSEINRTLEQVKLFSEYGKRQLDREHLKELQPYLYMLPDQDMPRIHKVLLSAKAPLKFYDTAMFPKLKYRKKTAAVPKSIDGLTEYAENLWDTAHYTRLRLHELAKRPDSQLKRHSRSIDKILTKSTKLVDRLNNVVEILERDSAVRNLLKRRV